MIKVVSSLSILGAMMLFSQAGRAQPNKEQSRAVGTTKLRWKCSTAGSPWADKPDVTVSEGTSIPTSPRFLVLANSKRREQAIDGWGGCFNERGWKAMESLAPADRNALMRNLFDKNTGLKLNLCRTPIGASDYATTLYSLNETAGDYGMKQFSIKRDKERLIPYIKAAIAIRPDLKLWSVPWSPPSWMKTNNSLVSGNIKDDPKTLDALALYFARYVQAYRAEGIDIGMVMPQNEPNMATNYTSCLWTGEQFAKFVGYHLGPQFKKEGVKASIFLGSFNESNRGGYAYWVAPSLQDPNVRRYVAGVGAQWEANVTLSETHFLRPDLKLMQTEAECGSTNSNDWGFAEYQYQLAKKWFAAGASSNMMWNMVLDETGLSTGGWAQCSPIVVDTKAKKVIYTPYYHLYRHFSYFVQPGAHVIDTQSTWGDRIAFVNPNGEVVVVMGNSANTEFAVALNIDGRQSQTVTLPPHSFNTFVLPPARR